MHGFILRPPILFLHPRVCRGKRGVDTPVHQDSVHDPPTKPRSPGILLVQVEWVGVAAALGGWYQQNGKCSCSRYNTCNPIFIPDSGKSRHIFSRKGARHADSVPHREKGVRLHIPHSISSVLGWLSRRAPSHRATVKMTGRPRPPAAAQPLGLDEGTPATCPLGRTHGAVAAVKHFDWLGPCSS